MRTLTAFCLAATLPLFAQHEKEVDKTKFIGDLKAIEAGRALFANGCAACHGADGRGGRGPNLREKIFWHPVDDETLYKAIQKGISGGMPPANSFATPAAPRGRSFSFWELTCLIGKREGRIAGRSVSP